MPNSNPTPTSFSAYQCARETTRASLDFMSNFCRDKGGSVPINQQGDTLLHFLAVFGNVTALNELIQKSVLSNEELAVKNSKGDSSLHEAARFGKKEFAEAIANRDGGLVFGVNNKGETPLFVAAACGNREVFWALEGMNSDCFATRDDGSTVLHAAVNGGNYLFALNIVDSYPELARKLDGKGSTPLHILASTPSAFRSGSLSLLRHLGRTDSPMIHLIALSVYLCIPAFYVEASREINVDDSYARRVVINRVQRSFIVRILLGWGLLKEMDHKKQKHVLALALAKRLIEEERDWSHYIDCSRTLDFSVDSWVVANPLIEATKHDLDELVIEILRKYPNAANCLDANGRNILQIAVKHKCRQVYEVLKKNVAHKDRMIAEIDNHGNTMLHLATNRGALPNFPMTDLDQMTWDVHWFKIITRETYPHQWSMRNKDGKTAEMLFEENHSIPRDMAEKTSKDMNQGLLVVSTLIGAISITALLTIPGGFDGDNGHPVLVTNYGNEMQWFFIYVWIALFSSIFSLGGLLSVQVSAFHMDDFYVTLPLQILVSTTALFNSTAYTITIFAQAYILESALDLAQGVIVQVGVVLACILMGTFFVDQMYLPVVHIYEVIYYSFAYRPPKL